MLSRQNLAIILGQFLLPTEKWEATPVLSSQAFSGSELWKIETFSNKLVLRRWADETDPLRLASIGKVLAFVDQQTPGLIAPFLPAMHAELLVVHENQSWTLSRWIEGTAEIKTPCSRRKIQNALRMLARFHQAVKLYPGDVHFARTHISKPPGLNARSREIELWLRGKCEQVRKNLPTCPEGQYRDILLQIMTLFEQLAPSFREQITQAAYHSAPLQICLRDVWRAHVLFQDDDVTGIIDYDAMRVDSVATDIARLLGSMAGDEMNLWEAGLVAYAEICPLSVDEHWLISAYDRSAVLLTGLQWAKWLVLEKREFPNPNAVHERLAETLHRLLHLHQRASK